MAGLDSLETLPSTQERPMLTLATFGDWLNGNFIGILIGWSTAPLLWVLVLRPVWRKASGR